MILHHKFVYFNIGNYILIEAIIFQDCLSPRSMQALPAAAESLCIVDQPFESGAKSTLHLNIGLSNGVLLRTTLDSVSGDLADTRTRYDMIVSL